MAKAKATGAAGTRPRAKTGMIRARVDPALKVRAEAILMKLGLNASDAIRLFYKQITIRKGLPFDVRIPNAATRKALRDADRKSHCRKSKGADGERHAHAPVDVGNAPGGHVLAHHERRIGEDGGNDQRMLLLELAPRPEQGLPRHEAQDGGEWIGLSDRLEQRGHGASRVRLGG